jgi:beta-lactam-binding protein with PASTA domain
MSDSDVDSRVQPAPEPDGGATPAPPAEAPKENSKLGLWIGLALVVVLAVGGVAALTRGRTAEETVAPKTATAPPASTAPVPPGTTRVPSVVGMSKESAEQALTNAGFVPLYTVVVTVEAEPDSVVEQYPGAGLGLVKGSQVAVGLAQPTLRTGAEPVPSPNVYQMTKSQAQSAVLAAGLMPVFVYGGSTEAKGTSYVQGPVAGVMVPSGGTVVVVLSNGVAPTTASIPVPDVVGKTQAAAEEALKAAGLGSQVVTAPDATIPSGSVFQQVPPAGGLIGPKAPIVLLVSLGPVPPGGAVAAVPDVKGMDAAAAVKTLIAAGFLSQQADVDDAQTSVGKVAGQLPSAGTKLPTGSVVIVGVAAPL